MINCTVKGEGDNRIKDDDEEEQFLLLSFTDWQTADLKLQPQKRITGANKIELQN
jgi:hypothetical protein